MKKTLTLAVTSLVAWALIMPPVVHAENKDKGPLTKKVFIHYKKPKAKPDGTGKPPKPPAEDEGSYSYIAKGMLWKRTENYILNTPSIPAGLNAPSVLTWMQDAMDTWDDQVDFDIFGVISAGADPVYLDNVDNKNVIMFAPLDDPRIIAITYVWGYFNAPVKFREIVEVDILFNAEFIWGDATANMEVMDVLNIATHELGHAAGMGDLYDTSAGEETMFGYSEYGEIKKRDLYRGDIAGITNLYK